MIFKSNCVFIFQVFSELITVSDHVTVEKKLAELSDGITALWDVLMGFEMQLVDQLEV